MWARYHVILYSRLIWFSWHLCEWGVRTILSSRNLKPRDMKSLAQGPPTSGLKSWIRESTSYRISKAVPFLSFFSFFFFHLNCLPFRAFPAHVNPLSRHRYPISQVGKQMFREREVSCPWAQLVSGKARDCSKLDFNTHAPSARFLRKTYPPHYKMSAHPLRNRY